MATFFRFLVSCIISAGLLFSALVSHATDVVLPRGAKRLIDALVDVAIKVVVRWGFLPSNWKWRACSCMETTRRLLSMIVTLLLEPFSVQLASSLNVELKRIQILTESTLFSSIEEKKVDSLPPVEGTPASPFFAAGLQLAPINEQREDSLPTLSTSSDDVIEPSGTVALYELEFHPIARLSMDENSDISTNNLNDKDERNEAILSMGQVVGNGIEGSGSFNDAHESSGRFGEHQFLEEELENPDGITSANVMSLNSAAGLRVRGASCESVRTEEDEYMSLPDEWESVTEAAEGGSDGIVEENERGGHGLVGQGLEMWPHLVVRTAMNGADSESFPIDRARVASEGEGNIVWIEATEDFVVEEGEERGVHEFSESGSKDSDFSSGDFAGLKYGSGGHGAVASGGEQNFGEGMTVAATIPRAPLTQFEDFAEELDVNSSSSRFKISPLQEKVDEVCGIMGLRVRDFGRCEDTSSNLSS